MGEGPPEGLRLDYAESREWRRRFWFSPALIWAMVVLTWVVMGLFVVPQFEAIFRDFKVELPWISFGVVAWSRWMRSGFGWMALLGLPIVVVFLVPRTAEGADAGPPVGSRVLLILGLLLLVASVLVFAMSLVMPLAVFIGGM